MKDCGWKLAATSAVGSSHLKIGRLCEDSHAVHLIKDTPDWLIACVSDGAGSATKGREGAEFICGHFVEYIKRCVGEGMSADNLTQESILEWLCDCRNELEHKSVESEATLRDYAATFLGAVIHASSATLIQIGDGAIVAGFGDSGDYEPIFWPAQGEYANQTLFVTSEVAAQSLFVRQVTERPINRIAMFSDGLQRLCLHYATRSAHRPFFDRFFSDLQREPPGVSDSLSLAIEQFLLSDVVAELTDDDATLVVACRDCPEGD